MTNRANQNWPNETDVYEVLTRHDADAVDYIGRAVSILRTYSTIDGAKVLLEAVWANTDAALDPRKRPALNP